MPAVLDLTGQTYGRLTVLSREGSTGRGASLWLCRCECGTQKVLVASNLRSGGTVSCGCYKRECDAQHLLASPGAPRKPDNEITYDAAHQRVRAAFGPATKYSCFDCAGPAAQWSLQHDAPEVHWGVTGTGYPARFSGNSNDYEPRCRPCHFVYDGHPWHARKALKAA